MQIKAPWTREQVRLLNQYQQCTWTHPFTCPYRGDERHKVYHRMTPLEEEGQLVATKKWLTCPACGYKQDWCHDFMVKGAPPKLTF